LHKTRARYVPFLQQILARDRTWHIPPFGLTKYQAVRAWRAPVIPGLWHAIAFSIHSCGRQTVIFQRPQAGGGSERPSYIKACRFRQSDKSEASKGSEISKLQF
jgi:hypothetical protein